MADTDIHQPYALVGVLDTPAAIYHACEALRDAGYQHFDAHTPYPVHGLEKAMGVPASKLPWLSLGGGAFGLGGMVWLSWYVNVDYPLNISGKPHFSYQAFVPLYFEMMVLFCALATFFGLWGLCRLPTFFHPIMTHPKFPTASDDKFLISVEARDPKFDRVHTKELLAKLGAHDVEEVYP